ncbi:MAG TPA: thiamine pyrophosphate-binding protein [Bacteroidales bacterium]|jgi:acetolactate synthase-1/2/3 large subunit|nr:thiamine pyrophosphate-binding protein [Bacteroidales bacterium]
MTTAEYIAERLYRKGVRYVFGIPGGASIPYIDAFRKCGIEFILTSNESAAGIMADVTARLTGTPGICHATLGPGATNLTTGAGGALLDRSAVIAFTSEVSRSMIHRTTQMNIDHQKLFEPVCKATFRMTPENTAEVIDKAFHIAAAEYPGPVHIGLPSDLAGREVVTRENHFPEEKKDENENDVQGILDLLERSSRPVLAVGLTFARLGSDADLRAFLDRYKMPVVLTPMAKGVLDEGHPCYAGVLFHGLSDYLEDIFRDSDLVIGLGYDPVEYDYESWMPDIPLLHFNTVKTDLPQTETVKEFTGDPADWFRILRQVNPGHFSFNRMAVESMRTEMLSVFNGFTDHFGPVTALKVLQDELPPESIITFDVGSHLHLAGQFWNTRAKKNIIMTNGWSGMGFGLPAALAAKMARPVSPVVCVTGDGGFLMMAGEIITARRYNLPVIVVVLADGELNLIRLKQTWENINPYATRLYSGDLFDSDVFLGIRVITADSEESMLNAVRESLSLNSPVIINARIDPDDYNWLVVRKKS